MTTQNLQDAAKAVLRKKFIAIESYPQETGITLNRQPNFTAKPTGKRTTTKNQQKERNHKDRSRNN